MGRTASPDALTVNERQILEMYDAGLPYEQICAAMPMQRDTTMRIIIKLAEDDCTQQAREIRTATQRLGDAIARYRSAPLAS